MTKMELAPSVQMERLQGTSLQILAALETLIKVSALQVGQGLSTTERARTLKLAGMDNQTIAAVLNTSSKTVSVLTANLRKTTGSRK